MAEEVEARVMQDPVGDIREQNALLREQNALLKRLLQAMGEQGHRGPKTLSDHIGDALRMGKFDGILEEVRGSIRQHVVGADGLPRRRRGGRGG